MTDPEKFNSLNEEDLDGNLEVDEDNEDEDEYNLTRGEDSSWADDADQEDDDFPVIAADDYA